MRGSVASKVALILLCASASAGAAFGQGARPSEPVTLDIPAQPLGDAINEFGRQTGLHMIIDAQLAEGKASEKIAGKLTPDEALRQLLRSSGLKAEYLDDQTVAIRSAKDTAVGVAPSPNAGSHAGPESLEEVIVTAQKRIERLVDVPLPITAVTASEIGARGISTLEGMQYAIPGLTLAETSPGRERMQLNGVASGGGATGLPVVGVYLDEMPISTLTGLQTDVRLLDMERVEVLHGPQPTLYGEGAMGGTIRYVTAAPDLEGFSSYVEGEWGNVTDGSSSYRANAVLNAPLIEDKLAVRVAAGFERDGGWIDSSSTGARDINDIDFTTVRAKVLFRPVDNLSVSFLLQQEKHNQAYENFGTPDRDTATVYPTNNNQEFNLAHLVMTYDFGPATLVSSTGYFQNVTRESFDLTQSFLPFLPLLGVDPATTATISRIGLPSYNDDNVLTQELRLGSNGSGPFNYLLGAYFRNYRTDQIGNIGTAPGSLPFELETYDDRETSKSWAAFGEARYAFAERYEVLVGLRHFEDQQQVLSLQQGLLVTPGTASSKKDFVSNNPRLNLSYRTSSGDLLYVNVAKGFRSGIFNLGAAPPAPPSAGPESLWTYTVGTKQEWFDHRLSVDLSGYYNRWSDIQSFGSVNGLPVGYYTNSGKASGPGANLSIAARVARELTLSATLGYADMRYDDDAALVNKGDPVDMVARWTYSIAAAYRHALSDTLALTARLDFGHTSGFQITQRDQGGLFHADLRNVLNVRAGVDLGVSQLYVFGTNLTDDNGRLFPAFGAFFEPALPAPRTIGVGAKLSF